jgi:hypothetical protein
MPTKLQTALCTMTANMEALVSWLLNFKYLQVFLARLLGKTKIIPT